MGKILVIAEKPSVARDIAKVLQAKQKGEGCLIGERYVVSWAVGHLVTLAEPEEYDEKYKKWNFSTLPILPEEMQLKAIKQTRDQLKILHSWMHKREIDSLICATDSGREGELIFRYIYEITKCKKPFQRLWISSMTEEAIKEGFRALKDGREYDLLYTSAKCRSEADWLVGMNATRAYTLQYHALLSIGRVQTPTLALIVERQKEIDAFTAEDYFEVQADFGGYTGLWIDREEHTRIDRADAAQAILAKTNGKPATITKVEKEEKKTPPPLLYDLTELQRECNRKFGFSAKMTLDIAQSLYEKRKMITYPRTDRRYLSEDMKGKVKSTIHRLQALEEYAPAQYQAASLTGLPLRELETYIDRGIPVAVWATIGMVEVPFYYEWISPEDGKTYRYPAREHCLVLVGYDDDRYYFNDPYNSNGLVSYHKTTVEKRYETLGRQAVAILPRTSSTSPTDDLAHSQSWTLA